MNIHTALHILIDIKKAHYKHSFESTFGFDKTK